MTDLTHALAEISAIRAQLARDTQFRGYGPASIAASGTLALLVAAAQAAWLKDGSHHAGAYLAVWVGTAVVSVAIATVDTVLRARRVHSGFASHMIKSALEQFLPAVVVGVLLTAVLALEAPHDLWMLPGLWQLNFSLGVFASCRFLPRPMFGVGVWYLITGLVCLMIGSSAQTFSPWEMGIPFGVGQWLVAGVLHYGFDDARSGGDSLEER